MAHCGSFYPSNPQHCFPPHNRFSIGLLLQQGLQHHTAVPQAYSIAVGMACSCRPSVVCTCTAHRPVGAAESLGARRRSTVHMRTIKLL